MDNTIIFVLIAIIILIVVIIKTFSKKQPVDVKTKNQKKAEIVDAYKMELREVLGVLQNDKQAKLNKKKELLKKFSNELSKNIFFDNDEIRGIILELSKES